MKPVSLKEIADRLDFLMDEWNYYLDKKSGEIVEIQTEYCALLTYSWGVSNPKANINTTGIDLEM